MIIDAFIDSPQNETFRKLIRLVESSRERRRTGRSVIEGVHLIESFWQANFGRNGVGGGMHWLFVCDESRQSAETTTLLESIQSGGASGREQIPRTLCLTPTLFKKVSQVENGQGPLAVIDTPRPCLPERLVGDSLYLDRVQDPGNVGSILRTSAAAGLGSVLTSPGAAFSWAPKVLRSAMGAHFSLAVHEGIAVEQLTDDWLDGQQICALVAPGQARQTQNLTQVDLRAATLWLAGSEGQGLSDALLGDPRVIPVTIDQVSGVESMNVAAAVAVALFEQRRQRS